MITEEDLQVYQFLSQCHQRKKYWKNLETCWLNRLEGKERMENISVTSGNEVHGRSEELRAVVKLIRNWCILRVEKLLHRFGYPTVFSTFHDPNNSPTSCGELDTIALKSQSLGIQIEGLSGSGKSHLCKSIALLAPWLRFLSSDVIRAACHHKNSSSPFLVTIDISEYLGPQGSRIFSQISRVEKHLDIAPKPIFTSTCSSLNDSQVPSDACPSQLNRPRFILEYVAAKLFESLQVASSLEDHLNAITEAAAMLQKSFYNYLYSVHTNTKNIDGSQDVPHIDDDLSRYLASGGGIIFVILKNVELLNSNLKPDLPESRMLSTLSINQDLLFTSKVNVTRVVSRLIEKWLVQWSSKNLPVILLTSLHSKRSDQEETSSSVCSVDIGNLPPELVERTGGFQYVVTLKHPLSPEARGDLLDYFSKCANLSPIELDFRHDLILSTAGFQPSDIRALVHETIRGAVLANSGVPRSSCRQTTFDADTKCTFPSEILANRQHFLQSLNRISPSISRPCSHSFEILPLKSRRWLSIGSSTNGHDCYTAPSFWGLPEIVGESTLKSQLDELVVQPFRDPFSNGGHVPCAIILVGDGASGKSHIARCIANACEANLIVAYSADIMKPKLGDSEKSVRNLFQLAHRQRPCVVLIENIEILCSKESSAAVPLTNEEYINIKNNLAKGSDVGCVGYDRESCSESKYGVSSERPVATTTIRVSSEILRGLDNIRLSNSVIYKNMISEARSSEPTNDRRPSQLNVGSVLVVMTTERLDQVDPRLLQQHRMIRQYKTTAPSNQSLEDLLELFDRHLQLERFKLCDRYKGVCFRTALKDLLPRNFSSIVGLTEAIGLCAIRRQIIAAKITASNRKNQLSLATSCESKSLCLCDVISALSSEKVQCKA